MSVIIHLQDIVDVLEMQFDESSSFLALDTGKIETVSNELLRKAEEPAGQGPNLPAWQQPEWEMAQRIVSSDRFWMLPTKFDVHEWTIMRDFSDTVESERIRRDILNAIHGAGAFRHFKEAVRRHQIEAEWFAFRAEALKQMAVDWCEEHHIAWK